MAKERDHEVAQKTLKECYPSASCAGSVVRDQDAEISDINLVVVYQNLPAPYRDSSTACGWPVEVFVHDSETVEYSFEKSDQRSGRLSLATRVAEGLVALTTENLSNLQYSITDLQKVARG